MGLCYSRSSVAVSSGSSIISYKAKKTLAKRREESDLVKSRFPNKLPVIIERHYKETVLPEIEKNKFLVPREATMMQLLAVLRNRLNLRQGHTFYFLINGRALVTANETLIEVYEKHADDDGFLYLTYTSQESFG